MRIREREREENKRVYVKDVISLRIGRCGSLWFFFWPTAQTYSPTHTDMMFFICKTRHSFSSFLSLFLLYLFREKLKQLLYFVRHVQFIKKTPSLCNMYIVWIV